MKCPNCGGDIKIVETLRAADNELWREKRCRDCKLVFHTVEFVVEENQHFKDEWAVNKRTRTHKKDSDRDMKEYREYTYDGPVMEFNRCIAEHWKGTTYAVSEQKARSNLTYQFKKAYGKVNNTNITLPGKITVL